MLLYWSLGKYLQELYGITLAIAEEGASYNYRLKEIVRTAPFFNELKILIFGQLYYVSVQIFMHKFYHKTLPDIFSNFYTPVCQTDVLCRGNVRPSVRPRFPDFSSTCFEILIWNLVYTFSRWYDVSSLSCITIGSLWLSLQPKVGQTHFLQSWPHKSRWILQIWYTGGLLYTSRYKFRFL